MRRYERNHLGSLIHVAITKSGNIPERVVTASSAAGKVGKPEKPPRNGPIDATAATGRDPEPLSCTVIDDHFRLASAEICPTRRQTPPSASCGDRWPGSPTSPRISGSPSHPGIVLGPRVRCIRPRRSTGAVRNHRFDQPSRNPARFAYAYFAGLDASGHASGPHSPQWRDVDACVADVSPDPPATCTLFVTGDHGMKYADKASPPSRLPGRTDDVLARWRTVDAKPVDIMWPAHP